MSLLASLVLIHELEQRIEILEKAAGIDRPDSSGPSSADNMDEEADSAT